jgi:hypothetical protein
MMFSVFEHFSPNWISDERLRAIGDGSGSIKQALDALAQERPGEDKGGSPVL